MGEHTASVTVWGSGVMVLTEEYEINGQKPFPLSFSPPQIPHQRPEICACVYVCLCVCVCLGTRSC